MCVCVCACACVFVHVHQCQTPGIHFTIYCWCSRSIHLTVAMQTWCHSDAPVLSAVPIATPLQCHAPGTDPSQSLEELSTPIVESSCWLQSPTHGTGLPSSLYSSRYAYQPVVVMWFLIPVISPLDPLRVTQVCLVLPRFCLGPPTLCLGPSGFCPGFPESTQVPKQVFRSMIIHPVLLLFLVLLYQSSFGLCGCHHLNSCSYTTVLYY